MHKSKDQLYSFNYPYQVGNLEEKGGFSKKDNGKQAYENEHVIEDYDIVIMASDGMWDNLYIRDISICV